MHSRRILLLTAATTVGLTATTALSASASVPVGKPPAQTSTAGPASRAPTETPRSLPAGLHRVTLITGDRVTVLPGGGAPIIEAGPGRSGMSFTMDRSAGGLVVIPTDARAAVAEGAVDRRLFDVGQLIRAGYEDGRRDTVPVIVGEASARPVGSPAVGEVERQTRVLSQSATAVAARAAARGVRVTGTSSGVQVSRTLSVVGGFAAEVPKARSAAGWRTLLGLTPVGQASGTPGGAAVPGTRIWLDGKRKLLLDRSVKQINAPAAYAAGFTGKGVTVAVLDGGVDATHPDLAGKVVAAKSFVSGSATQDPDGHGTHVASTVAGTGAASGGKYRGVAPDAKIASGRVCGGSDCADSAIVSGLQWAATEVKAKIISMSLGGPDTPGLDPLEIAVNTLSAQTGVLVVAAVGNEGGSDLPIDSPSSADAALAVGSVSRTGAVSTFSSRGPRPADGGLKPDVTAPGEDIMAARAAGVGSGPATERYITFTGTSMATPHVSGMAALLAQQHPSWTGEQLKAAIMNSARPNPAYSVFEQGAGLVDVAKAIALQVTATGSVSFPLQQWPHTDDVVLSRKITYTNATDRPIALSLAVQTTGAATVFGLPASSVTVPARGSAEVAVTADTRSAMPDGSYLGRVTATGAGQVLVTSLHVTREIRSYNLTGRVLDTAGKPAKAAIVNVFGMDGTQVAEAVAGAGGIFRLRLPSARYDLFALSQAADGISFMVAQNVDLTRDRQVAFDTRTTARLRMQVPDARAKSAGIGLSYLHRTSRGTVTTDFVAPEQNLLRVGRNKLVNGAGESTSIEVSQQWNAPGKLAYAVVRKFTTASPGGFRASYRPAQFATVRDRVIPDRRGDLARLSVNVPGGPLQASLDAVAEGVFTRKLASSDPRQIWSTSFLLGRPVAGDDPQLLNALVGQRRYPIGRTVSETWNAGPFGPAYDPGQLTQPLQLREGDGMGWDMIGMFSDAQGHSGVDPNAPVSGRIMCDGRLVGQFTSVSDGMMVPPRCAYRIDVTVKPQASGQRMPRSVSVSWSFRSSTERRRVALPVSVVQFRPTARPDGTVAAGRSTIPVEVQAQPGAKIRQLRLGTVAVSFDAGRTWRAVPVKRSSATRGTITLMNPAGGSVSLRARASGANGVGLEQTVIGFYRVRR